MCAVCDYSAFEQNIVCPRGFWPVRPYGCWSALRHFDSRAGVDSHDEVSGPTRLPGHRNDHVASPRKVRLVEHVTTRVVTRYIERILVATVHSIYPVVFYLYADGQVTGHAMQRPSEPLHAHSPNWFTKKN